MNTLNLIPQEQKTILKNNRLYIAFKEAATLLLLFAAIMSAMLWLSRYYLEQQLSDLIIQNTANIKSNESTNKKIASINAKISTIKNIQDSSLGNRRLIEKINALTPANIQYSQIKFYRQQAAAELVGTAKNREELVKFREILNQADWIKKVDLPMNSLVDKENNSFNIKLEIETGKL